MAEILKIGVNIPPEFADRLMDAISERIEPIYPGYSRAFSYWPVKGTWIPGEGSDPYLGSIGQIETADEMRIEFAVYGSDLRETVRIIRSVHPYEEPCIDIIPMLSWKEFARGFSYYNYYIRPRSMSGNPSWKQS
jgi:hypothetical protein